MSGGVWDYQDQHIRDMAIVLRPLLHAVAETEHIVDWAEAGDTSRRDAERHLYDLWVETFHEVYGDPEEDQHSDQT
jgi:hypothetical protein